MGPCSELQNTAPSCSPLAAELRVDASDGHEVAAAQDDAIVGINGAHLWGGWQGSTIRACEVEAAAQMTPVLASTVRTCGGLQF